MGRSGRCRALDVFAVLTLVVGVIVLVGTRFLPRTPSVFAALRSYNQASSDELLITPATKASLSSAVVEGIRVKSGTLSPATSGFILPVSVVPTTNRRSKGIHTTVNDWSHAQPLNSQTLCSRHSPGECA